MFLLYVQVKNYQNILKFRCWPRAFTSCKTFSKNKRGLELVFSIWRSATKSLHQDRGRWFYPYLFYIHTLPYSVGKQKVVVISFPQQIRPQTFVQWHILQDYSSVKIAFNMINKFHPLPIVNNMLVKIC